MTSSRVQELALSASTRKTHVVMVGHDSKGCYLDGKDLAEVLDAINHPIPSVTVILARKMIDAIQKGTSSASTDTVITICIR